MKILSVIIIFFLVTVGALIVLDPISCPAKMHRKAVFGLRNGKIFKVSGWLIPVPP